MAVHRKKRRAIDVPGHAHFLTYSCHQRLPLLSSDRSRRWVIEAFETVRQARSIQLWAYVIMPEHVHVILRSQRPEERMSHVLASLKRGVARKARLFLDESGNHIWLDRLSVRHGGRRVFRFWQAGGGYDKNIWHERTVWQVIDYIHANPVRRGLASNPDEWEWSSSRYWNGDHDVPIRMDPIVI